MWKTETPTAAYQNLTAPTTAACATKEAMRFCMRGSFLRTDGRSNAIPLSGLVQGVRLSIYENKWEI